MGVPSGQMMAAISAASEAINETKVKLLAPQIDAYDDDEDCEDDDDLEKAASDAEVPHSILPEDAQQALKAVQSYMEGKDRLWDAVNALERMLPKEKPKAPKQYTEEDLRREFLGGDSIKTNEQPNPSYIAMVSLFEFFDDKGRFEIVDPRKLPGHDKLQQGWKPMRFDYEQIDLGEHSFSVPGGQELWVTDRKTGKNHIVIYGNLPMQGFRLMTFGARKNLKETSALTREAVDSVVHCKYFRGQVIELGPYGFDILKLGPQKLPTIAVELRAELEKNVVNMFSKTEEFQRYGLPTKRAVILEGPPGCGKTMIGRWLASSLKGKVTVLWVTAKSIQHAGHVAQVFEMARRMSPALIVMEDLDLISGTRADEDGCLGEMLNQMDGIASNDQLVMVASTNEVKSLDQALRDRPGRFDRIYEIGRPSGELAEQIGRDFLKSRGVSDELAASLDLSGVATGDFTGAQVVEILKGAFFEAIHRGCDINDMCIEASLSGLKNQRRKFQAE